MTEPRPDPITPRVTMWATIGTVTAGLISAAVDIGWKQPEGNHVMDWVYSLLPVVFAYLAVRQGAALAKEHTTPVADPAIEVDGQLVKLEPAGPVDVGFFDQEDPPPDTEF